MKKRSRNTSEARLMPFPVIEAASRGDIGAVNAVLEHYEGYITKLSTRRFYDEYGQPHYCVDETLRRRLETKLITKVLSFKIQR